MNVEARADVVGDDNTDQYIGTGALVLPSTSADSDQHTAITCADCSWRITPPCWTATTSKPCTSVVGHCPSGAKLRRLWFTRGDGHWRDLGVLCLGPEGVLTLAELEDWTVEQFIQGLPSLNPAAQPSQGVLPRIPVGFRSRQPKFPPRNYTLAGHRIRLTPIPSWTWRFGDGHRLTTDDPGAKYPNLSVAHAYPNAGPRSVRVRTHWTATYTVDGEGPFEVAQAIHQDARLLVEVGQARAVLTP